MCFMKSGKSLAESCSQGLSRLKATPPLRFRPSIISRTRILKSVAWALLILPRVTKSYLPTFQPSKQATSGLVRTRIPSHLSTVTNPLIFPQLGGRPGLKTLDELVEIGLQQ